MKPILIVLLVFYATVSYAYTDTLYIKKQSTSVGFTTGHFCSFLQDTNFSRTNANLQVNSGDTINLTLINLDTLDHTFTIDGVLESGNTIPSLDTLSIQILPLMSGTYRYYSAMNYGELLGASGLLQVGYEQHKRYCWNLFEVDVDLSDSLAFGLASSVPTGYQPSNFMINGLQYPASSTDTLTAIEATVNDTIIVSIVNSGNMTNSFHFHGCHFTILDAKLNTMQIGWLKDSAPILSEDAVTLMIVACQPGLYPIHSHNLIATTTGGIYPGGMITTINITP